MAKGRIIKLIGGQYTVRDEMGKHTVVKPLGVFRHQAIAPKVGDLVIFDDDHITEVLPRDNTLVRPPIANVDQAILIHSAKSPEFSFFLLDRFLTLVEFEQIRPVVIVTKIDLLQAEELNDLKASLSYYASFYDVYYTSVHQVESLEPVKQLLDGKVSVFAGQTGSGKSSLLNALDISLSIKTQEISKALGRGKHTTRHTELLELHGGLVADTPGFSKLDFYDMEVEDLLACYPDFLALSEDCKFRMCLHINEPGCAVKAAVKLGVVMKQRYDNYCLIHEEIKGQKKIYRKK